MKKQKLIKSNIVEEREAVLQELEKQIRKTKKDLDKQKNTVVEFQVKFRDMQSEVSSIFLSGMQKLRQVQHEIHTLIGEMLADKKIKKRDKKELELMRDEMSDMFGGFGGQEEEEMNFEEQFKDKEEADSAHIFDEFQVKPQTEEQQDIRKLFIRLANQFHPDKAKNETEAKAFHALMQRINEAYKRGDYAELLALETEYLNQEAVRPQFEQESETLAYLEREIKRKERELFILKDQITRTKQELKMLKASEMGKGVKRYERERRSGAMDDHARELEMMFEHLSQLKKLLEEFKRTGKFPEKMAAEYATGMDMPNGTIRGSISIDEDGRIDMENIPPELEEQLLEMLFSEMMGNPKRKSKSNRRR